MGRFVRLDTVLDSVLKNHDYPTNVSAALSEVTALAVLCASMLKFEGLFTLQLQGNGAVSLLVADVTSEGKVRACAKFDEEKLAKAKRLRKTQDIIEEVPHLIGGGYMALTTDALNGTPPYQGVVDLKGKTLSELALRYFAQSEQIDTYLKLFLRKPDDKQHQFSAAGIIVQKVPVKGGKNLEIDKQELDLAWEDIGAFVGSLTDDEVFDYSLSNEDLLYRLFATSSLQISGQKNFQFGCRCNKEKLQNTLTSFDAQELDDMCTPQGKIEATCTFCGQKYTFNREDLTKKQEYKH